MPGCSPPRRGAGSTSGKASWKSASAVSQRFEEADEVRGLVLGEMQRLEDALAVGVDSFNIEIRITLDHVPQRRDVAVVHVWRGARDVAQPGHAELAEIAVLRLDMPRAGRGGVPWIVVVPAEQVER